MLLDDAADDPLATGKHRLLESVSASASGSTSEQPPPPPPPKTRCETPVPYLTGVDDKNVTASLGEVKWLLFEPPNDGEYRITCRISFTCTRRQYLTLVRSDPECAERVDDTATFEYKIKRKWLVNGQPNAKRSRRELRRTQAESLRSF